MSEQKTTDCPHCDSAGRCVYVCEMNDAVPPSQTTLEARVNAEIRRRMEWEEAELHRMCAEWVSGLEPVVARDQHGNLLGLTHDCDLGRVATIAIKARPYPGWKLGEPIPGLLPAQWRQRHV